MSPEGLGRESLQSPSAPGTGAAWSRDRGCRFWNWAPFTPTAFSLPHANHGNQGPCRPLLIRSNSQEVVHTLDKYEVLLDVQMLRVPLDSAVREGVNLDVVCTLVTMAGSTMTWTLTVLLCLGLCWGPWDQVQAGVPPKPSIWADPGPIVRQGSPVTIWCQGSLQADAYSLYKERSSEPLNTTITQASSNKTGFLIQPMSSYDTGLYQCEYSTGGRLSERSEPLLLMLTGMYREPSLSAQPSFLVLPGDSLTLQCHSEPSFDSFALTKDEGPTPHQHLHGQHSPDFHLGPVNLTHGGRYRCYSGHNLSYVWSAPSAPLDILVTGMYRKPSLSVQPGPSVSWGVKVTLQCRSEDRADTFHLHREGSLDPPQQLHLQDTAAPSQANFTISPVTWGHQGTYRCYSSHSSSPFQLSQPSDPVELLVSGLRWGPWDQVQTGVRPKPSIWADPGPIVSKGSPVTIWCQGSLQADAYILYKERGSEPSDTSVPQASSNKTGFLIQSVSSQHTGLYQCVYSIGRRLSERSEPLLLVLSGEQSGPSLSAQPGPVVTSGGNVSLLCSSESTWDTFHLLKEGGAELFQHKESEHRSYERRCQADFPVGPVNSSHGGTYRCYGSSSSTPNVWSQPSAPLHLEVTGVYREPFLSAQPGPLLLPGDSLTLQCHSEPGFDKFALTKDEGSTPPQHLHGQHSPNFSLGPVNLAHRGRYRCYSGPKLSYLWSAPSAPLDILIAGKDSKPSLSAQLGPSVPLGANVTLQCRSEVRADTFYLHREGSLGPPKQLHLQDMAAPSQANFTISPVTSGHHGTYRCYSSHSSSPFELSQPSDPLELLVSGLPWSLNILIGVSGALVLLLSLLLFLLLRHRCQCKSRMSGAALKDPQPGEGLELDPQHNGPDDSSKQVTYAQVNCRSRLRQGVATSPSPLSEELLDKKGRQAEEDRQLDSQAAAAEDPKDVTYAQLTLMTSRRETSAPPCSPSEQPPDEPSVYATLAVH